MKITYSDLMDALEEVERNEDPEDFPGRCDPACKGWAVFSEDGYGLIGRGVEKCDDCDRFKTDKDALCHAIELFREASEKKD